MLALTVQGRRRLRLELLCLRRWCDLSSNTQRSVSKSVSQPASQSVTVNQSVIHMLLMIAYRFITGSCNAAGETATGHIWVGRRRTDLCGWLTVIHILVHQLPAASWGTAYDITNNPQPTKLGGEQGQKYLKEGKEKGQMM